MSAYLDILRTAVVQARERNLPIVTDAMIQCRMYDPDGPDIVTGVCPIGAAWLQSRPSMGTLKHGHILEDVADETGIPFPYLDGFWRGFDDAAYGANNPHVWALNMREGYREGRALWRELFQP